MKLFLSNLPIKLLKRKKYVIANCDTHAFVKGEKYEVLIRYPYGVVKIINKHGRKDSWYSYYFE